ncbi:unnamed protein product, partial [Ectocarpus sp. 12 AP-2014]
PPPPINLYSRNPHNAGRNTGTTQRTTTYGGNGLCVSPRLHKNPDTEEARTRSCTPSCAPLFEPWAASSKGEGFVC